MRLVRLAWRVLKANFGLLREPFKLTYVVTKRCGSRCVNCKIWKETPTGELSLEEIEKVAADAGHLQWIDFTGGEPTDREDFAELVGTFARHCPDLLFIHFPTNGLNPERIEKAAAALLLLKVPYRVVTVSLDGPPEVNDRLRGIKGDFDRALETYRRLKKLKGLRVYIGMTLYPDNVDRVDETVAAIATRVPGFSHRELHLNIPHLSGHYYGNTSATNRSIQEETLRDAAFREKTRVALRNYMRAKGFPWNPFALVERLYQRLALRYLTSNQTPMSCMALTASYYLSENGTVFPCLIWSQPIGSIRETGYSVKKLLQSGEATALRQKALLRDCPNCWTPCEAYQTMAANILKLV